MSSPAMPWVVFGNRNYVGYRIGDGSDLQVPKAARRISLSAAFPTASTGAAGAIRLWEVVEMFFRKNKIERDIDSFKAMQDKGLRVAKRDDRSDQPEGAAGNSSAEQGVMRQNEQVIDGIVGEPVSEADERQQSVVGGNASWNGTLKTKGSARIEGELSGEVEAGDTVYIEKGARVKANIHARRVIIGGDLEGRIVCREQLVVQRTGRLGGEVTTKTLVIEEGAVVQSQIQMARDGESARVNANNKKGNGVPSRRDATASEAIGASKG